MNSRNEQSKERNEFRVSRIYGAFYEIYNSSVGYTNAKLRGKLRLEDDEERNPICVGDKVEASRSSDSDTWVIENRLPRSNYLIRKSAQSDTHVLCANVDHVAILCSLKNPETKNGFLDRSIAACYQAGIEPLLVFTKKDLTTEAERNEKMNLYENLGYKCISISIHQEESILEFKKIIEGKSTYIVGNSGVGKSSLINTISGNKQLQVDTISNSTGKGKHTTTNSFAIYLPNDTVIIDSPGVKEWGVLHLSKLEILLSFPELRKVKSKCKIPHCCEMEEGCKMVDTLYSGKIPIERVESIESMIKSIDVPYRLRTGNFISGKYKKEKKHDHRKSSHKKDSRMDRY